MIIIALAKKIYVLENNFTPECTMEMSACALIACLMKITRISYQNKNVIHRALKTKPKTVEEAKQPSGID